MKYLLSTLAVLVCCSLAPAQPAANTSSTTEVHKLSVIIGTSLSLRNETIGKVTDVVISDGGCLEYVVVSYGQEFVAIPWQVITVDFGRHAIAFRDSNITTQQLRSLAFTGNRWPSFADEAWSQKFRGVFGTSAFRNDQRSNVGGVPTSTTDPNAPPTNQPNINKPNQPRSNQPNQPNQPGRQPNNVPQPPDISGLRPANPNPSTNPPNPNANRPNPNPNDPNRRRDPNPPDR